MTKICYIAGREPEYSRTRILLKAMNQAGFEVISCLPPTKSFKHYPKLIWEFFKKKNQCDLIIVGFYGQLLVPWIRTFSRKKILYDIYISTYDTMIYDRKRAKPKSILSFIYYWSDRLSMLMVNGIILETADHIQDYSQKFRIPISKFRHLFLAVDDDVIKPSDRKMKPNTFVVHFHGEYAPFHGTEYIIKAAKLLENENVEFEMIGTGITYADDQKLVEQLNVKNIRFVNWIPYEKLGESMSHADCCLGIFGENPRTLRVLTNKVIESLAVKRPLITAMNSPVQELLKDRDSALMVNRADPQGIADAICYLKNNPERADAIAERGYQVYRKNCTMAVFSSKLKLLVEEMLSVSK